MRWPLGILRHLQGLHAAEQGIALSSSKPSVLLPGAHGRHPAAAASPADGEQRPVARHLHDPHRAVGAALPGDHGLPSRRSRSSRSIYAAAASSLALISPMSRARTPCSSRVDRVDRVGGAAASGRVRLPAVLPDAQPCGHVLDVVADGGERCRSPPGRSPRASLGRPWAVRGPVMLGNNRQPPVSVSAARRRFRGIGAGQPGTAAPGTAAS